MTKADFHNLLEYFGQEQACYTSLLDLSRRQRDVIEGGDVDSLLSLLARKQQVLLDVSRIEEKLQPYKRTWKQVRESIGASGRQKLDLALSTVEELLAELIALERESEQVLAQKRDETERELAATVRGRAVNQAYREPAMDRPATLLDRTE